MQHIIQVDNTLWALISRLQGKELQTPSRRARFRITTVDANRVVIETGSEDSQLALTRAAFQQTLDYLAGNNHFGQAHAVQIGSNHNYEEAGPLCRAARYRAEGQPGPTNITYILPILEQCQAVGIRSTTPNSTWLLP
ncbi:hypothetical protein LOY33_10840 [Pseudomonas sp. B21-036]|uniref:hypothetical protein n=1 Tax=Pseudomonas TaxID=286 RepID=UPI0006D48917|nr:MULTISPECIES: hypothetical protein [Pseudomonas]MCP8348253.1 hypothetical protein [Pseudomonas sp. FBF18]MEC6742682.1 hypothetical protein [Pseudomonas qingdaonensis]PPS62140.1 hypothetical protein CR917_14665 [Pseudomonas sp. BRM28]UVL53367.1 hypothetical protein LOY33_10840 [Pseudomonas sp. B21-036]